MFQLFFCKYILAPCILFLFSNSNMSKYNMKKILKSIKSKGFAVNFNIIILCESNNPIVFFSTNYPCGLNPTLTLPPPTPLLDWSRCGRTIHPADIYTNTIHGAPLLTSKEAHKCCLKRLLPSCPPYPPARSPPFSPNKLSQAGETCLVGEDWL